MAEEAADALVEFRADDVLEFAGLGVRFVVVNAKRVFEQTLGQAMAPHHVARAALPAIG
jgi:hypothetical protein